MEGSRAPLPEFLRPILGFGIVLLLMIVACAGAVLASNTDPHGFSGSPASGGSA